MLFSRDFFFFFYSKNCLCLGLVTLKSNSELKIQKIVFDFTALPADAYAPRKIGFFVKLFQPAFYAVKRRSQSSPRQQHFTSSWNWFNEYGSKQCEKLLLLMVSKFKRCAALVWNISNFGNTDVFYCILAETCCSFSKKQDGTNLDIAFVFLKYLHDYVVNYILSDF